MRESTASIILSMLTADGLPLDEAVRLHTAAGSAAAVVEQCDDIRTLLPDISPNIARRMQGCVSAYAGKAEEEELWCQDNGIRILAYNDDAYPCRLRSCHDAPMTLFVRGGGDLNPNHAVCVVGTRKCTVYGIDFIHNMMEDLSGMCPDLMVTSGLAYGIDIYAHRAALDYGMETVAVVAHGQDHLYPALHRPEAERMAAGNGAVVSEFVRGTRPVARNFLQRNRIIAGMSDAVIVVESAEHGGSLVTARIAQDYGREVFAVPGPVTAEYSRGCNSLIRDNKAALITNAADMMEAMMWQEEERRSRARRQGIERSLFPELSDEERRIIDALKEHGDCQTNLLIAYTAMPISTIVPLLFSLEMKGMIAPMPGNTYHLIS